jgi:hypothetical protein
MPGKTAPGNVKTPTSFDDVQSYTITQLKEVAKKLGIKGSSGKNKATLLEMIRVHLMGGGVADVKAVVVEMPKPTVNVSVKTPTSIEELEKKSVTLVMLKKMADKMNIVYKKSIKKSELLDLLRAKISGGGGAGQTGVSLPPPAVVKLVKPTTPVSLEDLSKKSTTLVMLKKAADKLNIQYKKSIKKSDLLDLIRDRMANKSPVPSVSVEVPAVVAPVEDEIEAWPVPEAILKKKYNTVEKMKELLKKMGITKALPKKKDDIKALFSKKRCSETNFSCSEAEFCDLRNQLCRELSLIIDESGKHKKFEGEMDVVFADGTFYGPKHIIAKIRAAWEEGKAGLKPLTPPPQPPKTPSPVVPPPVKTPSPPVVISEGVYQTKMNPPPLVQEPIPASVSSIESVVSEGKDSGISPININLLLEKPTSEIEIRKAILNCLGLYQDINPNDEIL